MGGHIVHVQYAGMHVLGATYTQVGGNGVQLACTAAHQVERGGTSGVQARNRFGDGRGRADDQDLLHGYSITRRQKPDENRGSMKREKASQAG